jgi:hypothetical protein
MIFDDLIGRPFTETELVEQICKRLQARYSAYQQVFFFICLRRGGEGLSEIQWLKVFPTMEKFLDFFFDTDFQRSHLYVGFENGCYQVELNGYQLTAQWDVTENSKKNKMLHKAKYDPDKMPMMSRAEIRGYMDQLKLTIRTANKKKTG